MEEQNKKGVTGSTLKLIAIITMTIDHVGAVIFPDYQILRIIGRIAFPIFAYCIAVGCIYTKNIGKYALRVLLMAILIQPLYVTAMNHQTRPGPWPSRKAYQVWTCSPRGVFILVGRLKSESWGMP